MERKIISTNLSPDAFSKTHISALLNEIGFIVDIDKKTVSEWHLTGTENHNEIVYFTGDIFDFDVLSEIFSGNDESKIKKYAVVAVKSISILIEHEKSIGNTGGIGILIAKDCTKAAFVPEKIAFQCAKNSKETFAKNFGFYVYQGLSSFEQMLFMRGAISYKAMTGKFPFSSEDLNIRQADIFDHNFAPLSLCCDGIDKSLAAAVDCALSIPPDSSVRKEERWNKIQAEKRKVKIAPALDFDPAIFEKELLKKFESSETFAKFMQKKAFRTKINRFLRRNAKSIFVGIASSVIFLWAADSYIGGLQELATSRGLSSEKTAQAFYALVHKTDVQDLSEIAKGKKMDDFITLIAGFYVSAKERESYNLDDRTAKLEEYLFLNKSSSTSWQTFGISNLKIDGKNADIFEKIPKRKENPPILKEENGAVLEKNAKTVREADYFFVKTDELFLHIEKRLEKVHLKWDGKRWIVEELEIVSEKDSSVRKNDFNEEFLQVLKENGESVKNAANVLREKYPWIPDDASLFCGASNLAKHGNALAKKFIEEYGK